MSDYQSRCFSRIKNSLKSNLNVVAFVAVRYGVGQIQSPSKFACKDAEEEDEERNGLPQILFLTRYLKSSLFPFYFPPFPPNLETDQP